MPVTSELAYLTADLPGIGGCIKQRPEDFLVDEQPLYQPSGSGEHVMLYIEKTNLTTMEVIRRLAKTFRVGRGDVGYAGLKDKHAVTRQHLTVYLPDRRDEAETLERLESHPRLKILWFERHHNKLRRGHLKGNRFVIRIRDVSPTSVVAAKRVLDRLGETGLPNFLGDQRFGYRQNSHLLGRHLLLGRDRDFLDEMLGKPRPNDNPSQRAGREAYERGDFIAALEAWPRPLRYDRQCLDELRQGRSPADVVRRLDRNQRDFLISAWQSYVFNRVLDRRLREGTFDRLLPGDLAWKHDSRAVFAVDEATAELENGPTGRVPAFAVSPSGPLWGVDMTRAAGEPGRIEDWALAEQGLSVEQLAGVADHGAEGRRRPLREPLIDPDLSAGVDEHGPYVRLAFELPRGVFATIALREIMKSDDMLGTGRADDSRDE